MKSTIKTILCILLVSTLGCSSVSSKDKGYTPEKIAEVVNPGDTVNITSKSGGRYQFIVTAVTSENLSGGGVTVKNTEINELTIKSTNGIKKTFRVVRATTSILHLIHLLDHITH